MMSVQKDDFIFNNMVDYLCGRYIFNYMVEYSAQKLDLIFHALGDETRRQMLSSLANGERTVSELAEPFSISLAAASKHIKALERAGLIHREISGRVHRCRLEPGPLATAHEWLRHYESFWTSRLEALEMLLRAENAQNNDPQNVSKNGEKP